jgi:hypothetical protein
LNSKDSKADELAAPLDSTAIDTFGSNGTSAIMVDTAVTEHQQYLQLICVTLAWNLMYQLLIFTNL